jgi:hypothetical protein
MKKPGKSIKPMEGHAFSAELEDGRYAIGVFSRVETARPRKPYGVFVYFFAPYSEKHSLSKHLSTLQAEKAIAKLNTSALAVYDGRWQSLGPLPNWNKEHWPMPDFFERDYLHNNYWRVRLNETDLAHLTLRQPISSPGNLHEKSSHGSLSAVQEVFRRVRDLPSIEHVMH